ncbi:MAG: GspH/FimT family protein [Gallionella sp.]
MKRAYMQRGFTLLELLVVLSVVAILATIAVPSMTDFVRANRLTAMKTSIVSDLNLARSESIKRNKRVLVCAANTGATDCAAATNWATTGWIVCYDANSDGACDATTSSNPNPIQIRNTSESTVTVTGPSVPIRFNAIGSQGVAGNTGETVTISGNWSAAKSKIISIAGSGNITSN